MNQIVLTLTEFKKHKASTYHSIRLPSVAVVQAHRPILLHTSTSIVCSCCRQSSPIPTEGTSPTFLSTRHGLGDLPASHGGPPPPARTSRRHAGSLHLPLPPDSRELLPRSQHSPSFLPSSLPHLTISFLPRTVDAMDPPVNPRSGDPRLCIRLPSPCKLQSPPPPPPSQCRSSRRLPTLIRSPDIDIWTAG